MRSFEYEFDLFKETMKSAVKSEQAGASERVDKLLKNVYLVAELSNGGDVASVSENGLNKTRTTLIQLSKRTELSFAEQLAPLPVRLRSPPPFLLCSQTRPHPRFVACDVLQARPELSSSHERVFRSDPGLGGRRRPRRGRQDGSGSQCDALCPPPLSIGLADSPF